LVTSALCSSEVFAAEFCVIGEKTLDLGCWADKADRAIPSLDWALGGGNYASRGDAINKCRMAAEKFGDTVYALQAGGWCAAASYTLADALSDDAAFKKYGKSTKCSGNGKGGGWANQVYFSLPTSLGVSGFCVKGDVLDLGCWTDTADRAIPGIDGLLGGNYKTRTDAINKCRLKAEELGHTVYALQAGGWCASATYTLEEALSEDAAFKKYGKSTKCSGNGKGGGWANQVYFTGELPM